MTHAGHILVVEDDDADYEIVCALLRQADSGRFITTRCCTLQEGLDAVGIETDVILLDLLLPDSRGLDTFTRMRDHAPHIPVILLTGMSDEALGMQAVQGGAQDYLIKGEFDGRLLARAILYAIERKTAEERLQHLADELIAANTVMQTDLVLARDVQQAIMTRSMARRSGTNAHRALAMGMLYRPCQTLGGDFCAVLDISDDEIAVLVCDVMGHGVRSALITALLRGLIEDARPLAHDPGRCLAHINGAYMEWLRIPRQIIFITAVCVYFNARSGLLRGASAGHTPVLHVRAEGVTDWLAGSSGGSGSALGLESSSTYRTIESQIMPGERLVMFTDGVIEAHSPDGNEFGLDKLRAVAASDCIVGRLPALILEAALGHAGEESLDDDACVVCLERSGTGPIAVDA